jgi:two-component system NtrC family sensor kinase
LLSRLLARIVHDFNNPLAAILGFSDLLKNPELSEEKRLRYIQRVHEQASRLSQLVEMMSDFSTLPACQPGPMKLDRVVRDALSLRQGGFRALLLSVETELPDQPIAVVGDRNACLKIISCLLNNLEQVYKEHPDLERRAAVRCGVLDNIGFLDVADAGPGVDVSIREEIFDAFFSTRRSGGLGLGLTVSRTLAREMGGDLVLMAPESCALGGACFRLTLPLEQAE